MGERHPSRGDRCELKFAFRDPQKALPPGKELIGIVGVELAADEWTPEMKEAVRPEVCRIGGDTAVISVVGYNALSGVGGANVEVYRTRGGVDAPKARKRAKAPSNETHML